MGYLQKKYASPKAAEKELLSVACASSSLSELTLNEGSTSRTSPPIDLSRDKYYIKLFQQMQLCE